MPYTLKAGLYKDQGVTEAVQTFQSPTVLIASSKTSPDVIYKITKAIVEGREEFGNVTSVMKGVTAADMAQNFGMPLSPRRGEILPRSGTAQEVGNAPCASSPATRVWSSAWWRSQCPSTTSTRG